MRSFGSSFDCQAWRLSSAGTCPRRHSGERGGPVEGDLDCPAQWEPSLYLYLFEARTNLYYRQDWELSAKGHHGIRPAGVVMLREGRRRNGIESDDVRRKILAPEREGQHGSNP